MGKREPLITIPGNITVDQPEFRSVKAEKVNRNNNNNYNSNRTDYIQEPPPKRPRSVRVRSSGGEWVQQSPTDRSVLRSHYNVFKTIINEEKEELCKGESSRFQKILGEVDKLHELVTNPREQITDAETLLDMANTLVATVRSYSKDGFTPADFLNSLVREFGASSRKRVEDDRVSINWDAIGVLVSPIFRNAQGCPTMIGPMSTEPKQRKVTVRKTRTRLSESAAKPEQLGNSDSEQKKDTDKNMAAMFNILRSKKRVSLENLILNRFSFAQTVENLFALSFLVKDGRAQIAVNDKGTHIVSPKNAPLSDLVTSGQVLYNHFVFRYDYKDWKLMVDSVASGEELMPHRYQVSIPLSQADAALNLTPAAIPTTPMTEVQSSRETMVTEL